MIDKSIIGIVDIVNKNRTFNGIGDKIKRGARSALDRKDFSMRKTKIVCTIGPACETEERLRELMLAGMDVARFNFSHGTHEEQKAKLEKVLKVREELGLQVATLLDTKGP